MGMMFRFKLNQFVLIWMLISLELFFATSCDAMPGSTPVPKPTCLPTTGNGFYDFSLSNVEGKDAKNITYQIFSEGYSKNQLIARREALQFLKAETVRWSHFRDEGEKNAQVRMIVTFITPELLQAVILNYVLSRPDFQTINLDQYMQDNFDKLKKRNEFVFLLTFLPTPDQGNKIFSVSPKDIRLHNTANLDVPPTHNDDFLNDALKFSEKNQSGFIFYPIGVNESGRENDCSRVLDPDWDTSLMLNITNATIGTQANQTISWPIPFASLLLTDGVSFKVDFTTPVQSGEESDFTPFPSKNSLVPKFDTEPDDAFWQEYSRFIWAKLTSKFE
jgi:hypothetical protein